MSKKALKSCYPKNVNICKTKIQGTAPYKHHLDKIGDFNGGLYKYHFQNWQFDASLLENFGKKVYLFQHFFKNLIFQEKGVCNIVYI